MVLMRECVLVGMDQVRNYRNTGDQCANIHPLLSERRIDYVRVRSLTDSLPRLRLNPEFGIGFGFQGTVQDVVTRLAFIFSDLVGLVQITGQTGIVKGITMRFIELQNAMEARALITNRKINNVIDSSQEYVR